MRIIAAYMLAVLGGNNNPDRNAVKAILDSVSSKYEDSRVEKLIADLKGKDLGTLITEGTAKMAAIGPIGGGGGGGGGGEEEKKASGGKTGGKEEKKGGGGKKGGDKKEEKKKEEEKEKEEEDEDLGLSLFG